MRPRPRTRLVKLPEIHPGVEGRDLIAVAIEGQRRSPTEFPDPPLRRLAPARMAHGGIDVGIEAVLLGRRLVPCRRRLLAGEADAHDRLGALVSVLPRDDHAD